MARGGADSDNNSAKENIALQSPVQEIPTSRAWLPWEGQDGGGAVGAQRLHS